MIREEGEDIGGHAASIMMADVLHHFVGLSTSAQFVGGPQKDSMLNERA